MDKPGILLTTRDLYHLSILGSTYRLLATVDAFLITKIAEKNLISFSSMRYLEVLAVIGLIYALLTYGIVFYLWKRERDPTEKFRDFVIYARVVTFIDLFTLSGLCLLTGCHASRLYIFFIPIILYAPFFFKTRRIIMGIAIYISAVILAASLLESRNMIPGANAIAKFCSMQKELVIQTVYIPGVIFFIILFSIIMSVLKRRMENNFLIISEEKEKLANLQQFLERIIMTFPLGVIIFEEDRIRIFNEKIGEIFEIDSDIETEELKGILEERGLLPFIEMLINSGGGHLSDVPLVINDKKKYLEIHAKKLDERSYIIIIEDITEKKLQEQRTLEAEANMLKQDKLATIGQMAAGIAHELNNPIAGINSLAQLLLHRMEKNKQVTESDIDKLQKIIANTDRITRLIRNLLQFSKPSAKKEKLDVNRIINEILSLFEYQFKKHNVKVEVNLARDLPPLEFNRTELEEIIVNLLQNAIQFLDKEEKIIRIETGIHEGREIEIVIEDNGKGIPPEDIDRIFTPFYTTRNEGTGLGLSIINNILEKNNGKIIVTSHEGKGSRFVIRFPIDQDSGS